MASTNNNTTNPIQACHDLDHGEEAATDNFSAVELAQQTAQHATTAKRGPAPASQPQPQTHRERVGPSEPFQAQPQPQLQPHRPLPPRPLQRPPPPPTSAANSRFRNLARRVLLFQEQQRQEQAFDTTAENQSPTTPLLPTSRQPPSNHDNHHNHHNSSMGDSSFTTFGTVLPPPPGSPLPMQPPAPPQHRRYRSLQHYSPAQTMLNIIKDPTTITTHTTTTHHNLASSSNSTNKSTNNSTNNNKVMMVQEALHGTNKSNANALYLAADLEPHHPHNHHLQSSDSLRSLHSSAATTTTRRRSSKSNQEKSLQFAPMNISHNTNNNDNYDDDSNEQQQQEEERLPLNPTPHSPKPTHVPYYHPHSPSHVAPPHGGNNSNSNSNNNNNSNRLPVFGPATTTTTPSSSSQPPGYYEQLASPQHRVRRQKQRQQHNVLWYLRCQCLNPRYWMQVIFEHVVHSLVCYVALPCFLAAWILFYYLGNPTFDFLPEQAGRLSWWLNFIGRQVLLLELSRLSQWLFLDVFVLSTKWSVQLLGPLLTLTAIQAKGWPFVVAAWGIWDMLVLLGDNKYAVHWLYWTDWKIYNTIDSGAYLLSSATYLRILVAMVLAGLVTTAKRTAVTIYFGRRQLVNFKPSLEKLLGDIVLLSQVAALGEEAVLLAQEQFDNSNSDHQSEGSGSNPNKRTTMDLKPGASTNKGLSSMVYSNVHFTASTTAGASGTSETTTGPQQDEDAYNPPVTKSCEDDSSLFSSGPLGAFSDRFHSRNDLLMSIRSIGGGGHDMSRDSSGNLDMKSLLDRWEEPAIKNDKSARSSTIEDVLRFRRALACMDEEYPFGEAFGPADSRDACIQSANSLYYNLLKLDPTSEQLSYELLSFAIVEEDATEEYRMKKVTFRKLFRPDMHGKLPLLAFVQSCDYIYRRLRYFIASVRNSSVIDQALEDSFNVFFYLVLTLLLMSVMRMNPWPILVSVTSLLVSISFALGPSVSKFVEGVLLIAARRPYDLGDRIIITDPNCLQNPGVVESWFDEDISLWATTLRFARTNEVSTVNNSAIAASRIVNCNRSPNAIIQIVFITNISILSGNKLDKFREALESYVKENPRTWEAVAYVRHEEYDTDSEKIFIRISVRHRSSWQDAARILQNRGQLYQFVFETGKKMDISFRTAMPGRVIYHGGDFVKPVEVKPSSSSDN
ncbi:hypothetical protein ACA910_009702 [Epithemia clementina (nom. ined.)]